jgi:transcription initiation factor TFIIIB Brf1 subunit/transcription initiation factor TFIIB
MKIELEIPEEVEREARRLVKKINLEKLLPEIIAKGVEISLKERLELEAAFKRLEKIASKSKLTEKQALALGEKLKESIARRHGLL